MLSVLLNLFETFAEEIARRLGDGVGPRKKDICRELFRLFVSLEAFLGNAVAIYDHLAGYLGGMREGLDDREHKLRLRADTKELLRSLKIFESHLRSVFAHLDLLHGGMSVQLVELPQSSYSLFKRHFVDDLAPKFIGPGDGDHYVLRYATQTSDVPLVNINQLGHASMDLDRLFKSGVLRYELADFRTPEEVRRVLDDCRREVVEMQRVRDALASLIRAHCELSDLFA